MAKKEQEEIPENEFDSQEEVTSDQESTDTDNTEKSDNSEDSERSELEKTQEELQMLKDKHMRLYAEFENFRRRTAKERLELMSNAGRDILSDLLPVLDDMERAILSNETATDIDSVKEGFTLVHGKFQRIMLSKGLKEMDSKGTPFNTDEHEAITKIPAPSDDLKGKIVDVVEKGYFLNESVLRYAKVVVGE